MAYPSVRSSNSGNADPEFIIDLYEYHCTMPATISAGDVLILWIATDGNTQSLSSISGWTKVDTALFNNGTTGTGHLYKKVATGSEDGTVVSPSTTTNEPYAYVVYAFQDTDGTVTASTEAYAASAYPKASICDPGTARDYYWLQLAGWDRNRTVTYPTAFTLNRLTAVYNTTGGCGVAAAGVQSNASSYTPAGDATGYFTIASDEWSAYLLAIHPTNPNAQVNATAISRSASFPSGTNRPAVRAGIPKYPSSVTRSAVVSSVAGFKVGAGPTAVSRAAAIPDAKIGGGLTATTVDRAVAFGVFSVGTSVKVQEPTPIGRVVLIPSPNVGAGVGAPALSRAATISTAQVGGGLTATTVDRAVVIPAPQVGSGLTATAVARSVAVPTPQVSGGLTATTITRSVVIPTPQTGGGLTAAAITCQATVNDKLFASFDGTADRVNSNYTAWTDGDLDVRAYVRSNDWTNAKEMVVYGEWGQSSYAFDFYSSATGVLSLDWCETGGTTRSSSSTTTVPATDRVTDIWVRAVLDVSVRTIKFYTSSNGTDWTQLGSTITAAPTSIRATAGPLYVGAVGDTGKGFSWAGRIYEAAVYRNDILIANPKFSSPPWDLGDTTNVDAQGNTWTLSGPSIAGMDLNYGGSLTANTINALTLFEAVQVGAGITAAAIEPIPVDVPVPDAHELAGNAQVEPDAISRAVLFGEFAVTGGGKIEAGAVNSAVDFGEFGFGAGLTATPIAAPANVESAHVGIKTPTETIDVVALLPTPTLQYGRQTELTSITLLAEIELLTELVVGAGPSSVDAPVVVPGVTLEYDNEIELTQIDLAAELPTPQNIGGGGKVETSSIARSALFGETQVGITTFVSTIACPALVSGAQVGVKTTLSAINRIVAFGEPALCGGGTVENPESIDAPVQIPTPTIQGVIQVMPETISATTFVTDISYEASATVYAAPIDLTGLVATPDFITGWLAIVYAVAIDCPADIPSHSITAYLQLYPDYLAASVEMGGVTLQYGARIELLAITLLTEIFEPVGLSGGVGPDPIEGSGAIPGPTIQFGAGLEPVDIGVTANLATPTLTCGAGPESISAMASVPITFVLQYGGTLVFESGISLIITVSEGQIGAGITLGPITLPTVGIPLPQIITDFGTQVEATAITCSVVDFPDLTLGLGSGVTAGEITRYVLVSPVTIQYGASLELEAISLDVGVASAQVGAGASPGSIENPTGIPGVTLQYGARLEPLSITLLAEVYEIVGVGGGVGPDPVESPGSLPGPTVQWGSSLEQSAVPAPASFPGITTRTSESASPEAIGRVVGVPTPTLQYSASLELGDTESPISIPQPTLRWGGAIGPVSIQTFTLTPGVEALEWDWQIIPNTVGTTASISTPTIKTPGMVIAAPIALDALIPNVTLQWNRRIDASAITTDTEIPSVATYAHIWASPATVNTAVHIQGVALRYGYVTEPEAITLLVDVFDVTLGGGAGVGPDPVSGEAQIVLGVLQWGSRLDQAQVGLIATLPLPTARTNIQVSLNAVPAPVAFPVFAVLGGSLVSPDSINLSAAIPNANLGGRISAVTIGLNALFGDFTATAVTSVSPATIGCLTEVLAASLVYGGRLSLDPVTLVVIFGAAIAQIGLPPDILEFEAHITRTWDIIAHIARTLEFSVEINRNKNFIEDS